jgi:diketogulonate reductase-like aldo/keto reductase
MLFWLSLVSAVPTFILHNGIEMPMIGFGTAGLGDSTGWVVQIALSSGFTMFDTAQAVEWYRETQVAEILDAHCGKQVFVITKIHPRDFGFEKTLAALERSLNLFSDLDAVLLHSPLCWPGQCPEGQDSWIEAYRALQEAYLARRIKAIGVSNVNVQELEELRTLGLTTPMIVQNWMDPLHQDRLVREYCAQHHIAYMSYSSLGNQHFSAHGKNLVLNHPVINSLARSRGWSVTRFILTWLLNENVIIIPRSSKRIHIEENSVLLEGFEKLTLEELKAMRFLDETVSSI